MNWPYLLAAATRIGWQPAQFWAAAMWELTVAIDAHVAMLSPPAPDPMSDDAILKMFGIKRGARAHA